MWREQNRYKAAKVRPCSTGTFLQRLGQKPVLRWEWPRPVRAPTAGDVIARMAIPAAWEAEAGAVFEELRQTMFGRFYERIRQITYEHHAKGGGSLYWQLDLDGSTVTARAIDPYEVR